MNAIKPPYNKQMPNSLPYETIKVFCIILFVAILFLFILVSSASYHLLIKRIIYPFLPPFFKGGVSSPFLEKGG